MNKSELQERTRQFAVRVFKLVDRLNKSEGARVVANQLLKVSSSVAANYRVVGRAKSKSDFSNKLKIVLEEADESNFWLTFIGDVGLLKKDDDELKLLTKESDELVAIFTASVKTMNKSNVANGQNSEVRKR